MYTPESLDEGTREEPTWLRISVSYFDPATAGRANVLGDRFGTATARPPWVHVVLAEAWISEESYERRQSALYDFLHEAIRAQRALQALVGTRARREEGFISLRLTHHSSEAAGGISVPDWFLRTLFAEPAEFNIS